ncbi:hypothetical protein OK348_12930 [Flavobacterium sp. MXW15]|uniref:Leucine-rich repeat domain-containing protein n=1 Tax=Xanthomonas chitinilytica TaxID=2989819 RepID=A0ABT3JWF4_9XANT|nr:hypothetical protein [Xanthomonas sp. H13-6]MCW4455690.1 hypothetical protein [Flavobacterium sp. MXW15]MCW4472824.1 hypothetical protein [Xanthomonas sp. H13-6]
MTVLLRVDDFRCHDQHLVRVLPGREREATCFARQLLDQGVPAGLFVQGEDVTDWGFLEDATGVEHFEFVDFSKKLSSSKLSPISHAKFLRIVGRKIPIEFSIFKTLQTICYHWHPKSSGLESLTSLKNAYLYEIGIAKNANPFPLPQSVEKLELVGFRGESIDFMSEMDHLTDLEIIYARNLRKLPRLKSLKEIELKNVGRDVFAYDSIPESVEGIVIEACAPVHDWDFILGMNSLKRLVVFKTKCAAPSSAAKSALRLVAMQDLPLGVQ